MQEQCEKSSLQVMGLRIVPGEMIGRAVKMVHLLPKPSWTLSFQIDSVCRYSPLTPRKANGLEWGCLRRVHRKEESWVCCKVWQIPQGIHNAILSGIQPPNSGCCESGWNEWSHPKDQMTSHNFPKSSYVYLRFQDDFSERWDVSIKRAYLHCQ